MAKFHDLLLSEDGRAQTSNADDDHHMRLQAPTKQPIDFEKFWAELDALGAQDYLPDGIPDDPPVQPDPRKFFD